VSQTPATAALDAAGIAYRSTEYELGDHEDGYGAALVAALGLDADAVGKTLVAVLDEGLSSSRHVVAVVPVSASLDLKALARAAGAKRATMADASVAERLSGSVVGGIAPLGHRRPLPVYIDELLTIGEEVHVSGGRRGLELTLAPADLVRATDATIAPIAT
jgi:Cys-tRNA(Pro)/Cys-tRNA(Cys) deacylase